MEVVKEKLLTIWTLGVLSLEMIIKLGTMAYANIFFMKISLIVGVYSYISFSLKEIVTITFQTFLH